MNVLIVDDRPPNLKLLSYILESEGHTVCEAPDGVEALEILHREKVDAIISDILMPRMDGYRLCQEVRKSETLREIPFIFYTATYTSPSDEKLCMDLGGDKFLQKPATAETVLAALLEVTQNGNRRKSRASQQRDENEVMKEYSAQLVFKLEEKIAELVIQTTAMETAANAIVITDDKGHILRVNPAFTALSGYAPEEAIGHTPSLLKSGRHDPAFYRDLWQTILSGQTWRGEFINRRKDGSLYYGEQTITPVRAQGGPITHFIGIMNDVTARKRAEESLKLFRNLVDRSNDAFEVIDPESGRFLDMNEKGRTELGCTREECLSLRVCDIDPTVTESAWPELAERIRTAGSVSGEGVHRRKDGTTVPIEFSAKWVRLDRDYIVTVARDISERKRAEQVLMESERRFREMLENVELIAIIVDTRCRLTFCNDFLLRTTGWTREEALGADWCDKFIPGDVETKRVFFTNIEAGTIPSHYENPIKTRDARIREIVWNNTMLRDAGGNVIGVASIGVDVTDRNRAEKALQESELRLRQVVETIQEVFWMVDLQTQRIVYVSPNYETIWGRTCESLYASPTDWLDAIHPDDRDRVSQAYTAKATTGTYSEEFRIICPDGQERWIRDRGFPVKDEDGNVYRVAGVAADITERKILEQQFLRAQRMESIGTLAGGIAHDLNNVLGPIIMSLDLLKLRFPQPENQELLEIVGSSAQRGADMVRQVLSFARGVEGRRMEVQVKHLIRDIEKIANDTLLKNIQVRTVVPHDLWTVLGDPTQLHQVLLNLCVNARDAMPNGGKLTIAAENRTLDDQYAGLNLDAQPGPYVFLQVEDSGTGMPPEVMEKIFDPFYTTKEIGKGTGLGLSTSLAIVKSHGGFIQVYSEVGKGTKFRIYLPAQTEIFGTVIPEAVEMPRGNGELILVVDDEASVRQITQQTLQAFGYRVVLACDGAEAVATYATHSAEIAVVVTDMMMPIMDGPSTIRVLRKMNPKVRIIGASGLSAHGHATQAAGAGVKHFLPKPYTAEVLLKALRDILSDS